MIKSNKSDFQENRNTQSFTDNRDKAKKINVSTVYDTCKEQLIPFGGILALIKFLDLVDVRQIFDFTYLAPTRKPKQGHYKLQV